VALLLVGTSLPADAARPTARDTATSRATPDTALAPQSVQFTQAGEGLLARGEHQSAIDHFETALAVDPRNVRAYLGMARAFEGLEMPGRAIRFYREALAIEPNDVLALEAQGHAFLARGATGRAEANLERLRKICASPCPAADRLASAVARGGPPPAMAAATRPESERSPREQR
ncbi:MAG: tetratricopeptide repeat protein, partial [Thermaurantiacus sp.]